MRALREREGFLVGAILAILLLGLKWPVLHTPLHWDEMLSYVLPAHQLFEDGLLSVLPGLGSPHKFFYHPPLFPLMLAVAYQLFGDSIFVVRITSLAFAWLLLFFTYKVGTQIAGRWVGILSVFLLVNIPIVFAQSSMFMPEICLSALILATWYFYQNQSWRNFLVSAAATGFIRYTSLAFAVPLVLYSLFDRRLGLKHKLLTLIPVLTLGLFLLSQKWTTGHFFNHLAASSGDIGLSREVFEERFQYLIFVLFRAEGRWLWFVLLGTYLFLAACKRKLRKEFLLFLAVIACFVLGLSFNRGALYRYLTPCLTLFAIMTATALQDLLRYKILSGLAAIAFVILTFNFHAWSPRKFPGMGQENTMAYLHVVKNHKEVIAFLEEHYLTQKIAAPWPISTALSLPYAGYTKETFQVTDNWSGDYSVLVVAENADDRFTDKAKILLKTESWKEVFRAGEMPYFTRVFVRGFSLPKK